MMAKVYCDDCAAGQDQKSQGIYMSDALTPITAAEIISRLLPIGDHYYKFSASLEEMGFVSISAVNNFFESLATTEEELSLHRSICIDFGKESFASLFWTNSTMANIEYTLPFRSKLLDNMREYNRNHGTNLNIPHSNPYLMFRYRGLGLEARLRHQQQSQQEFFACREQEITKFLPSPHGRLKVTDDDAKKIVKHYLADELQASGFLPLPLSSKNRRIILAKHLFEDWWLKFIASSYKWDCTEFHAFYQGVNLIDPCQVEFALLLSQEKKQKPSSTLRGLPILFADLSPLGDSSFSRYTDMDECAVGILGYVKLYELMADELEGRLIDCLKKL